MLISIRRTLTLFAVAVFSMATASAQYTTSSPATNAHPGWEAAQSASSPKENLFVVTRDRPTHKEVCRIQAFTAEKLVCSRAIGGRRTYLRRQVLALIIPGDAGTKLSLVLGFNISLGAAIWGTVVLVATCLLCAAATGVAALVFFAAAGAVLIGDDQPNRLLYLAPNESLSDKLGYIQS